MTFENTSWLPKISVVFKVRCHYKSLVLTKYIQKDQFQLHFLADISASIFFYNVKMGILFIYSSGVEKEIVFGALDFCNFKKSKNAKRKKCQYYGDGRGNNPT